MNLCIVQARTGSTRLPNKVLLPAIEGMCMLEHEIMRIKQSKKIDRIVIATTVGAGDDPIEKLCEKIGVDCFRGSEDDVLDRYAKCAQKYPEYENIMRLTGDCPLIDPKVIDKVIEHFENNDFDFVGTGAAGNETYPDGMDTEIFTREALMHAAENAKMKSEREHVTLFMRSNPELKIDILSAEKDYSNYRLTLDEQADYEVIKWLMERCVKDSGFRDYVKLLDDNQEIFEKNSKIIRNAGLKKSLDNDGLVK